MKEYRPMTPKESAFIAGWKASAKYNADKLSLGRSLDDTEYDAYMKAYDTFVKSYYDWRVK